MVPSTDLPLDGFRLLDVDNRVVLPISTQVRMLITAADVIHSWTIPRFGVKVDGVPGRLNQISFIINRPGLYYGQCSEICGANHSFIPIVVEATNLETFVN
jgi:cytochrome c oxidase subunit 2